MYNNLYCVQNRNYCNPHPASHHSPDYDDLGAQGLADSEDGHETEAEDDEVDAEEDFTRVEELRIQPTTQKLGDSEKNQQVAIFPLAQNVFLEERKLTYISGQ